MNKGLALAAESSDYGRDGVVAWLNCDEQYLPGILGKVTAFFHKNPHMDILFGGMLMVDPEGSLLSCRNAMPMRRLFLEASYLYNFSCAMFIQTGILKKSGGFDPQFRNAGDEEWLRRALLSGAKTRTLEDYLSVFVFSNHNQSSAPQALWEHERLKRKTSFLIRMLQLPINGLRLMEKMWGWKTIKNTAVVYEIYLQDLAQRTQFTASHPTCKWPDHPHPYWNAHRLK